MKIKKIKRVSNIVKTNGFEVSNNFVSDCKKVMEQGIPQYRAFLSEEYAKTFPSRNYPDNIAMELVRLAIAYELVMRDYKAQNLPLPEKVRQNHQAAVSFCPEDFDSMIQGTIKYKLKTKGATETMKTKKAVIKVKIGVSKPKEIKSKVTLAGRYIDLFNQIANGKKISDKEMVQIIKKEFGKTHTEDRVRIYRSLYHQGKLAGQGSKPKKVGFGSKVK